MKPLSAFAATKSRLGGRANPRQRGIHCPATGVWSRRGLGGRKSTGGSNLELIAAFCRATKTPLEKRGVLILPDQIFGLSEAAMSPKRLFPLFAHDRRLEWHDPAFQANYQDAVELRQVAPLASTWQETL